MRNTAKIYIPSKNYSEKFVQLRNLCIRLFSPFNHISNKDGYSLAYHSSHQEFYPARNGMYLSCKYEGMIFIIHLSDKLACNLLNGKLISDHLDTIPKEIKKGLAQYLIEKFFSQYIIWDDYRNLDNLNINSYTTIKEKVLKYRTCFKFSLLHNNKHLGVFKVYTPKGAIPFLYENIKQVEKHTKKHTQTNNKNIEDIALIEIPILLAKLNINKNIKSTLHVGDVFSLKSPIKNNQVELIINQKHKLLANIESGKATVTSVGC